MSYYLAEWWLRGEQSDGCRVLLNEIDSISSLHDRQTQAVVIIEILKDQDDPVDALHRQLLHSMFEMSLSVPIDKALGQLLDDPVARFCFA